jgi:hypothetical protein
MLSVAANRGQQQASSSRDADKIQSTSKPPLNSNAKAKTLNTDTL